MSVQAADTLMSVFGLKRTTVMVYDLARGDRFTIEGSDIVWTFRSMDGMYCYAYNDASKVLNWSGPVTRAEE
jgi:hypothetical protein